MCLIAYLFGFYLNSLFNIYPSAMQDIESERLERERSIREMRDALQGIQFQLNATNNHKNQVEKNVSRINEHLYQLR